MLLRNYVHTRENFDRWASEQRRPSAQVASAAEGRRVKVTIKLPARVRVISNVAGLLGGIALWDRRQDSYGVR